MALSFTVRTLLHLRIIFVCGMTVGGGYLLIFPFGYIVVPALFVEKIFLSPIDCFETFSNIRGIKRIFLSSSL